MPQKREKMSGDKSGLAAYFEELKRRKVVRVAAGYVVGAWVLLQVADATFEPLNLPQWSTTLVLWLLVLGFPIAVMLAWGTVAGHALKIASANPILALRYE